MDFLKILEQNKDIFYKAADLAVKLRTKATISKKFDSGIAEIDIVTSSDLDVQEYVLKELAKTELKNCELVAEEKTESVGLFVANSKFVLTLDPIDGTKNYANGGQLYSIIVTLHDKKDPIYTFNFYPELNWGVEIVKDKITIIGSNNFQPQVTLPDKIIGYSNYKKSTKPNEILQDKYDHLIQNGYRFMTKQEIGASLGPTISFISGLTDGILMHDISAVDGLVALHFGLAKGYKIERDMNIEKTLPSSVGGSSEYKGYYLILKEKI